jgi:hypothetical protein
VPTASPSALQVRKFVVGTDPAANAEASSTVPAGKSWDIIAYSIVNVQGGAGTSQPTLVLDDGTNIIFQQYGASAAQGVSSTQRYTWSRDLPMITAGTTPNIFSTAPLPDDLLLPPGGRIRTITVGLSANTDYGAPTIYVVEYG